jgi:CTP synthase (UTP-ammonia lyase)
MLEGKICTGYQRSSKIELWETSLQQVKKSEVSVAIIGKYMALEDSYSSVVAALEHVGHAL